MMTRDEFFRALLRAAKEAGADEAEAYFAEDESFRALASKGQIDDYSVNTAGGVSLRVLKDGRMGSSFTEALDEEAIPMLVNNALASAALIDDEDEQFIFAGSPEYQQIDCTGDPGTPEERIAMALKIEREAREIDPHVTETTLGTGVETERTTIRLMNTRGLDLSHTADMSVCMAGVVARDGSRATTGDSFAFANSLSALDAEKICREAVEEAVFMLPAAPCASGAMPAIFRNTCMVSLLSTFSGVFSAEAAQKGLSLLKGREGEKIAAECVTLVDDPLMKGGAASRPFDGEGVATRRKEVISHGTLTTLLHNLKTAKKAGCESTGNAARGGYASPAMGIAPMNFHFQPGEDDLDALCAKMGRGIVITDVSGLHAGANAVSGDFSLLAQGYLVEDGKKAQPVEQVTVAGNFFEVLKNVVAVGSDLKFPGGVGSPSVWVREISVAGK